MQSARAMYDLKVKLLEYLAPPGLLPDGFRRALKPLEGGVICLYKEFPPEQILTERAGITHDRE